MSLREIFVCRDADGACTVKVFGAAELYHFSDLPAALAFVEELPGMEDATLTLLETQGRATAMHAQL